MTTDENRLNINNWFEENIVYEGEGYAEFSNPKGWVRGLAKVTFDQTGKPNAYLKVSEWECEHGLSPNEYKWLITGRKFSGMLVYPTKFQNSCTKFQIKTENGIFETLSAVNYNGNLPELNQVNFNFSKSQYTTNNPLDAQYWVMPLTNFVSDSLKLSHMDKHNLDNHPLRVFTPPQLNDEDNPIEMEDEIRNLRIRNYFIEFGFGESLSNLKDDIYSKFEDSIANAGISSDDYKPYDLWVNKHSDFLRGGFIEILPNYDEKTKELTSSQSKYQITSLMVGKWEKHQTEFNFDEKIKSLPNHFSLLLSFASGSYVGVPWVELRGNNRGLVSRLHIAWGILPYQKGIITLEENRGYGITNLLTHAPIQVEQNLREAIRLSIKIRHYNHLSDILTDLFRAFDTMTIAYRNTKHHFKLLIDPDRYQVIEKIIRRASECIKKVGEKAHGNEKNAINNTIANNAILEALKPKNTTLAQAVIELIKSLGLNDMEVVSIENWVKKVNIYRNQVIHEVYFDFEDTTKNQGFSEAGTYLVHLYDLLIRIILKMLNYDGIYKSYLKDGIVFVDWVKLDTPPSDLGYKQP